MSLSLAESITSLDDKAADFYKTKDTVATGDLDMEHRQTMKREDRRGDALAHLAALVSGLRAGRCYYG